MQHPKTKTEKVEDRKMLVRAYNKRTANARRHRYERELTWLSENEERNKTMKINKNTKENLHLTKSSKRKKW